MGVLQLLRSLQRRTIVDIPFDSVPGTGGAAGTGLVLGLKFQGFVNGLAQFTN